jgi:hypothetical protein
MEELVDDVAKSLGASGDADDDLLNDDNTFNDIDNNDNIPSSLGAPGDDDNYDPVSVSRNDGPRTPF